MAARRKRGRFGAGRFAAEKGSRVTGVCNGARRRHTPSRTDRSELREERRQIRQVHVAVAVDIAHVMRRA